MKKISFILLLLLLSFGAFTQEKNETNCRIWKPDNLCDFPDSLNIPQRWSCSSCYWTYKNCKEFDINTWTGVWLTFTKETDSTFSLRSHYKNISLVNKNTKKVIHPKAIVWYPIFNKNPNCLPEYMPKSLRAMKFTVNFIPKEKVDLILIFEKAEKGDKLIIDDFIETEITE